MIAAALLWLAASILTVAALALGGRNTHRIPDTGNSDRKGVAKGQRVTGAVIHHGERQ